ncbi:ferric reductase-like transmembrane domain-containing protein [Conexibacter sp. DBS9H8]|uniref:ferric reductase-like transmembrane domain-containing protein n=1 Tax=Conexibacter sp. DBS9H8 TaxID=2937801 RepID=UPI00200F3F68|nr:ferric reductase-like transmembrane domain-containing protein [Conexibacter sp. DBS9H8]
MLVLQYYVIRATGTMTLILFTATVTLGLLNRSRVATDRWPRFVIDRIHRNASLLAAAFLAVHILSAVTDSFIAIPLTAAFIPLVHTYSTLGISAAAVACDLLLAVLISSLVKGRLGYGSWRAIHWLAYAAWPVALLHGIGNGIDRATPWMILIDLICVGSVLSALALRLLTVPRLEAV